MASGADGSDRNLPSSPDSSPPNAKSSRRNRKYQVTEAKPLDNVHPNLVNGTSVCLAELSGSQKNATSLHLHQSLTKLAKLSHQATQIPPKRSQERSPTNQTLTICFTNLPHNLLQTWPVLLHHLQKKRIVSTRGNSTSQARAARARLAA